MTDGTDSIAAVGTTVADRSLGIATALSAEVIVLRQRLDIIERLAIERGLFAPGDIDAYRLTPEQSAAAKAARRSFLDRVFAALRA